MRLKKKTKKKKKKKLQQHTQYQDRTRRPPVKGVTICFIFFLTLAIQIISNGLNYKKQFYYTHSPFSDHELKYFTNKNY